MMRGYDPTVDSISATMIACFINGLYFHSLPLPH